mmetsp:Transcript_6570/g.9500  ORF Transcript_6570/g.9500 Transcript_6570/m.9500 type:complete len:149 (-) Transcript_6570:378-824(-)|eukprot:CAMPEP_0184858506 /NCGR_PEP_ID=MMETSP0580-20130426/3596_1 /TAXON_ID=1118495 /ORGANISM="Dactyliosolen fragilissimus" /LENGTH=148 /DNA_ID=CAMNT_0027354677 /DNA_START=44 /DNA_END=493 /DNA_ORIENTATION=-
MAGKLGEEELADLRASFQMFDKDGSGTISTKELKDVMIRFGQNPSDGDIKVMMAKVDEDGNGEIDFDEFAELMGSRVSSMDPDADLKLAFRLIDTDSSGTISDVELKALMAKVNQNLTDEEIDAIMQEVDADGNKEIDFEEFKKMMTF